MILPGHIAAAVLCHRYLKADLRVAFAAALIPDLVDKTLYYGFRAVPSSRVPMHTLLAWLGSTMLVLLAAWGFNRSALRTWGFAWFLSYGVHLLCDSPLAFGELPFLWPFWVYDFKTPTAPFGFLFGLDSFPVLVLLAELLLVAVTLYLERFRIKVWFRRWLHHEKTK